MGADNAYSRRDPTRDGDEFTPTSETADLVSLNMAAPVISETGMTYMLDNPKTLNRSGVYIDYYCIVFIDFNSGVSRRALL